MSVPKRSSDNYIRLRQTVSNKHILNIIGLIAREKLITREQVCLRFIEEQAMVEINKRS